MRHALAGVVLCGFGILSSGCMLHALSSGQVAVTDSSSEHRSDSATRSDDAAPAPRALNNAAFSERDRVTIRAYFRTPRPNLSSHERLPARVARYDVLPANIAGRVLPTDLEIQLSRLGAGLERRIVGRDIVLYERERRTIHDIVYDALP